MKFNPLYILKKLLTFCLSTDETELTSGRFTPVGPVTPDQISLRWILCLAGKIKTAKPVCGIPVEVTGNVMKNVTVYHIL